MSRSIQTGALALCVILSACGSQQDAAQTESAPSSDVPAVRNESAAVVATDPVPPKAVSTPADRAPDLSPPILTPEAERGAKGARNVLLSFARAIEQGQYDQAYAMLSQTDRAKWSQTDFARIFAGLDKVTVAVPEGSIEGAAGSSYYSAPITIVGPDQTGRPVRIEGDVVARRVNDVDGATASQRRWHLETVTLNWTH